MGPISGWIQHHGMPWLLTVTGLRSLYVTGTTITLVEVGGFEPPLQDTVVSALWLYLDTVLTFQVTPYFFNILYIKNKNAPNIKVKNIASCNIVIMFL